MSDWRKGVALRYRQHFTLCAAVERVDLNSFLLPEHCTWIIRFNVQLPQVLNQLIYHCCISCETILRRHPNPFVLVCHRGLELVLAETVWSASIWLMSYIKANFSSNYVQTVTIV